MKKVTPNPPPSHSDDTPQTPPDIVFTVRPGLSTEAALSNASEMLESATVCAYDCAEHLDGSSRKQLLAVVQRVEMIVPTLCVGMPPRTLRVPKLAPVLSPAQG